MGQEDQTRIGVSEKIELIDFIYIDKDRVYSFISQLHQGTLRSVKRKNDTTQGSSLLQETSHKGGGGGNAVFAKAEYSYGNRTAQNDNESCKDSIEEHYDPYHSLILNLLQDLDLPILESLPQNIKESQLVMFKSAVAIRNFETISKTIPILQKNKNIFLQGATKQKLSDFDSMARMLTSILSITPLSTDTEIIFKDGNSVGGSLKENYLIIKTDDISRSYGSLLPGEWYTLGILEYNAKNNTLENLAAKNPEDFKVGIDIITSAIKNLYNRSTFSLSPIIIFRKIST